MRHRFFSALLLVAGLASCTQGPERHSPVNEAAYPGRIRLACVGDSITLGAGLSENTYPEQLQRMLGSKYEVRNFGVSGATLLTAGDKPYVRQELYRQSLSFEPDVVVIMLGTNDSKPQNWSHREEFSHDYTALVHQYKKLTSHPRIWLAYPCPVTGENKYKIREAPVDSEIGMIYAVARNTNCGLIDVHSALEQHTDDFPDTVHPNAKGAGYMASAVYRALTGKPYKGTVPAEAAAARR
ncbi:MAG: GDSL-type esterase/lipase family protein [Phycisphaerae bacterium]